MWACSFRDRKDQGDMNRVYDMIRDAGDNSGYAAWQINPYFAGSLGQNFDFIYLVRGKQFANGGRNGRGHAGPSGS